MFRSCVFVVLIAFVSCQEDPAAPPPPGPEAVVMMQVQQEEMMSRKYLEVVLKLQHANFASFASGIWFHHAMSEHMDGNNAFSSFLQFGESDDFSDDTTDSDFSDDFLPGNSPVLDKPGVLANGLVDSDPEGSDGLGVDGFDSDSFDSDEDGLAGVGLGSDGFGGSSDFSDGFSDGFSDSDSDLGLGFDSTSGPSFGTSFGTSVGTSIGSSWGNSLDSDWDSDSDSDLPRGVRGQALFGLRSDGDQDLKNDLLASYYLLRATNVRLYQTITQVGDLQKEFYMDRVMQLATQGNPAVPPPLVQILYLKLYSTFLKTMKLAYGLQMISHFNTWLEDVLDVHGSQLSGSPHAAAVFADHEDDLVRHKLWAMSAFNSYASSELQLFYIEYYMEYMMMALAAPQQPPADQQQQASFLEEEATAEPSQSQFFPFMAYGMNPMMFMKIYKMYFVLTQYQAAHAGLSSAYADHMAYQGLHDNDPSNDIDSHKLSEQGRAMWGFGFARGLMMASHIEQIMGMFDLYALYQPMFSMPPPAQNN